MENYARVAWIVCSVHGKVWDEINFNDDFMNLLNAFMHKRIYLQFYKTLVTDLSLKNKTKATKSVP